jgi:Holliday junction resolvase-like predicted endonuclease
MIVEREILIAVLKSTRNGPIEYSLVGKNARIPAQTAKTFLEKLADNGLVKWRGKILEVSPTQRVTIAVQALKLGADSERVCRLLEWKEFESITTETFEVYDYRVKKNFRFKGKNGRRWEIDLVACKHPIIASLDCKHWTRKWTRAPIIKIVRQHVERTKAFVDVLPDLYTRIKLGGWKHVIVIPIILSLLPSPFKFYRDTPVVSVLQLQGFLNELPAHIDTLTHFPKKITKMDKRITDY